MLGNSKNLGVIYAIVSAVLFGSSTPAAKYLLTQVNPWLLAGLLYLGSWLGLSIIVILERLFSKKPSQEAGLNRSDWKWLASATFLGGILAPVLLMVGLTKINASTTSLLLNLESVCAAVVAWLIFKEHTSRRLVLGMLCIAIGSFILGWVGQPKFDSIIGEFLIVAACLCWGFDNNLSQKISATNPRKIVLVKTGIAGFTNTLLALIFSAHLSLKIDILIISGIVGLVGYGMSLVCFMLALRHIGTARTSAYFSLAPFVGAGFSILFLGDPLSWQLIVATLLMGYGIYLHLTEYHEHEHLHEALIHEHKHIHDEHHQHAHKSGDPPGEPHSHLHEHAPLLHSHPHYPDLHHRHDHPKKT
jgi:drug/metabolite transporter (DMT)-like permease